MSWFVARASGFLKLSDSMDESIILKKSSSEGECMDIRSMFILCSPLKGRAYILIDRLFEPLLGIETVGNRKTAFLIPPVGFLIRKIGGHDFEFLVLAYILNFKPAFKFNL